MLVHVNDEQDLLFIQKDSIEKVLTFLVEKEKIDCDEIAVHLINDQKISTLHKHYFDDPTPTDCISFPIDKPGERADGVCFLGEIFVSTETASSYAKKHALDTYEEVLLYIIHGFLHLIGYNDLEEEDLKKMREKEKFCIDMLKQANICLNQ